MKGAHGLQPADHEHVHCRYCLADHVHTEQPPDRELRATGAVLYGPHSRKGSSVVCMQSRGQIVPDQHRHQQAPS